MKRIIITITAALIALAATAKDADTLKIMSYNLRFGQLASMKQLGEFIASQSPDVVALQECDWDTFRQKRAPHQKGVKFINELAYYSGMFGVYGKAIDYAGGYYGIGILSKYPILKTEVIKLPNPDNEEQRVAIIADVELPDGTILKFASTHLEVATQNSRIVQTKYLMKKLKGNSPMIICGDMNAQPGSEEMNMFEKKWKSFTDDRPTFPSLKPEIKIDWMFARPAAKFEVIDSKIDTTTGLSDHCPVTATVIMYK